MGLFDSFYAPLTCPRCNQHFPVAELQTKAGNCALKKFMLGDDTSTGGFGFRTGAIETRWCCTNGECCKKTPWNALPHVKLFIEDFIFTGIRIRRPDEDGDDPLYDDMRTAKPEVADTASSSELAKLQASVVKMISYFDRDDYTDLGHELDKWRHLDA